MILAKIMHFCIFFLSYVKKSLKKKKSKPIFPGMWWGGNRGKFDYFHFPLQFFFLFTFFHTNESNFNVKSSCRAAVECCPALLCCGKMTSWLNNRSLVCRHLLESLNGLSLAEHSAVMGMQKGDQGILLYSFFGRVPFWTSIVVA